MGFSKSKSPYIYPGFKLVPFLIFKFLGEYIYPCFIFNNSFVSESVIPCPIPLNTDS